MKLLLTTLHSRYSHASLALPSIAAVIGNSDGMETIIREYTVNERPEILLDRLVAEDADIVAFSCYIWNIELTLRLAAELKLINPSLFIILGGPEVSFGCHALLTGNPQVDLIVRGEGELAMAELARLLSSCGESGVRDDQLMAIDGISFRSGDELISSPDRSAARLDDLPSPFAAGLVDIAKPLVYLETSRGCPFSCAFCLSSTERTVRILADTRIESDLLLLMQTGVATIKFVDRTFNFDASRANRIWRFILANNVSSRFHFEIAADLLTDENLELLATVPPDTFRFEIGVQSAAADTLAAVSRKSDLDRLFANVRRLKEETAVTLHLDLVAGLPGEDYAGFSASLGLLLAAKPHHIQVEPLKMLKGTELRNRAAELGYRFSPFPPYRILETRWLTYTELGLIERCSQLLEEVYNSGRFPVTLEILDQLGLAGSFFSGQIKPLKTGGGSIGGLFQLLAEEFRERFPEQAERLIDGLKYDYCMLGYPGSSLPDFIGSPLSDEPQKADLREMAEYLGFSKGERFRSFSARFIRNYTAADWPPGSVEIAFIYRRGASGEQVISLCNCLPR